MPTYEYRCKACGHEFEEFQSITAEALKKCPECRKNKLERLIGTGAAILFKGSGFYETDYRSKEYKEKAKAEKKDSKPVGSDSSSSDSKKPDGKKPESKKSESSSSSSSTKSDD